MIKIITLLLISNLIFACSFGISKINEDNNFDYFSECDKQENVKVLWIGNSRPFVTSKTILGRINRFVRPYTINTSLIELEINNDSSNDIIFEPLNFNISLDGKKLEYLNIDYFKEKWPTSVISTTEQLIDQSIAIGEVIRTIVRKKLIDKNKKQSFIIPFEKINSNRFLFSGTFKINQEIKNINCEFIKK